MALTQGKCTRCKRIYEWKGKPLLSDAYCQECGRHLVATSHLNRWPRKQCKPAVQGELAGLR